MTGEELYLAEFMRQALKIVPGTSLPSSDGVLVQTARELSRFTALNQTPPPPDFVSFALQWSGGYDPNVEFLHYSYEIDHSDFADLKQQLAQWADVVGQRGALTKFGLGVYHVETKSPNQNKLSYVTLLATRQTLELKPLAKQIDPKSRFYLEGTTTTNSDKLKVFLTFLGETLLETEVPIRNKAFKTEFQMPSARAVYRFEIAEIKNGATKVVAEFPLYSRTKPPLKYDIKEITEPCTDTASCTKLLYESIHEIRGERRKAPVAVHPVLEKIAQEHAADMLEHHYSALTDRKGLKFSQKIRQNGLEPLSSMRFIDGDYSMLALLHRVESSPTTLKTVTNEHLTHMGCSVTVKNGTNNQNYYALSCGFSVFLDKRDQNSIRKDLLTTLNTMRDHTGRSPLKNCTELTSIAQEAAENIQQNPTMIKEFQGEVLAAIEDNGYDGRRLTFHVLTLYQASQLETTTAAKEIVESEAKAVAIGVQRASDPKSQLKGILVYLIAAY